MAKAGAAVTIFDTDLDGARDTAERLHDRGAEAYAGEVDVSEQPAVEAGVQAATDRLGPIHGLVNNAGVQRAIPILEISESDWDIHLDANAKGTFFCSKAFSQAMLEQGIEGAIVNVASTAAERAFPGQGAYATSKAGVIAFNKVLAKELGEDRITVNAVNPGTVDTRLEGRAAENGRAEEALLTEALSAHTIEHIVKPRGDRSRSDATIVRRG